MTTATEGTGVEDNVRPPIRVVLAEDESIIRLDLKETLEAMGYVVLGDTGRGDEAVDLIRRLEPDVAILDIKMPGKDGLTVAREVVKERLCAVLILSAFSQTELVTEAAEAGVLAYLVKPFQRAELLPAIEISLARFAQMKILHVENDDLRDQIEVRKLVDRAKGILMDDHHMSEADAFSFVQQSAMQNRLPMRAVAEQVIALELTP